MLKTDRNVWNRQNFRVRLEQTSNEKSLRDPKPSSGSGRVGHLSFISPLCLLARQSGKISFANFVAQVNSAKSWSAVKPKSEKVIYEWSEPSSRSAPTRTNFALFSWAPANLWRGIHCRTPAMLPVLWATDCCLIIARKTKSVVSSVWVISYSVWAY